MENGGNQKVNAIFEANLTVSKPLASASGPVRERFIRDKYERRKYYNPAMLQQFQESSESSTDDSEDEAPKRPVVRAPSEAAKKRAQARKQRLGTVAALPKAKPDTSTKKSAAVQRRMAPTAPAPAPDVDLLDFGLPPVAADPGPPPSPPSASPSPTLDMFKDMNISGNSAIPMHQSESVASSGSTQQNMSQTKKKMTSDDILGLFNAPMNNNMGYNNSFGNSNMMNSGMMMNSMSGMNSMSSNQTVNQMGNQMGMMNMNNVPMSNQQMPSQPQNMMQNNNSQNGMMNSFFNNSNSSMQQSNISFFDGMQNMNGGMPTQTNNPNNITNATAQQQQDFSMNNMAPMGGTPSNLTVMGGNGGNEKQSMYGKNQKQNKNDAFDFMGGGATVTPPSYSAENPQMNQFASFGSFR